MLIRICLIVAVVMSLATVAVSRLKVAAVIQETRDKLAETEQNLQTTRSAESKAKRDARTAAEERDAARNELETAKTTRDEAVALAEQQRQRANQLEQEKNEALRTKNETQTKLAEWEAFGMTPQRVRDVLDQNKKLLADMEGISGENLVLERRVNQLQSRLSIYEGEKTKVDLPIGLKGRVIAVDPKYDFVVLDKGQEDGVLERGEMLVSRSGKLVAKIRILSVQPRRSIANVLPDWKQADVMEGDQVVVGL